MKQTYIEKLESFFHPNFIAIQSNQEQRKWHTVSYVRMLEEMLKDRNITIEREPFPIYNHFIYVNDQFGNEKHWTIEKESNEIYRIFHYNIVTMIPKSKVYIDEKGRLKYDDVLYVPENVNRLSLSYIREMYKNAGIEIDGIDIIELDIENLD